MIRLVFFVLFLPFFGVAAAQSDTNLIAPSNLTKARKDVFRNTQDVADYIHSHKGNDVDKIRSAYNWVTTSIRYDSKDAFVLNAGPDRRAKIDSAFTLRRGVCENFSAIFQDIVDKLGYRAFVVEGITRQNNQFVDGAHTWVAIQIQSDWYFFDPTWDVGGSFAFFMVRPEQFIATHVPFDPMWQILPDPHFLSGKDKKSIQPTDSLEAWIALDSLNRLEQSERRIASNPIQNKYVKTGLDVVKMNLEIERQGQQVDWHEQATTLLNEAVVALNTFIHYRNDLSILEKTDLELSNLLLLTSEKIDKAVQYLDKIDASKAKLVMGTWPERERIVKLRQTLQAQLDFFNVYKNTASTERKKLFYQER